MNPQQSAQHDPLNDLSTEENEALDLILSLLNQRPSNEAIWNPGDGYNDLKDIPLLGWFERLSFCKDNENEKNLSVDAEHPQEKNLINNITDDDAPLDELFTANGLDEVIWNLDGYNDLKNIPLPVDISQETTLVNNITDDDVPLNELFTANGLDFESIFESQEIHESVRIIS